MMPKTRALLWFLLAILLIVILWYSSARVFKRPVDTASTQRSNEQMRVSKTSILPSESLQKPRYIRADQRLLQRHESASEFVLTGRITSGNGEPLPGTMVSMFDSMPSAPKYKWPAPLASVLCDLEGKYFIRAKSPVISKVVLIEKEGYAKLQDFLNIRDPSTVTRNYQLSTATGCLEGNVLDKDDAPIPSAILTVSSLMTGYSISEAMFPPNVAVTDEAGTFKATGLPESSLAVSVHAQNVLDGFQSIIPKGAPCSRIDFHLHAARTFSFMVRDNRGVLISDPSATCILPPNKMSSMRKGLRPGSLEWTVPLDTGSAQCTISAKTFRSKVLTIDTEDPPAEVFLDSAEIFSGRILSESGDPIAGAHVLVRGTSQIRNGELFPNLLEGVVDTNLDGSFIVPLSDPPVYEISVEKPGYAEQEVVFYPKPSPPTVEIRLLPAGSGVFGRITDASGNPMRRFVIRFWNLNAYGGNGFSRSFDTQDGRFSVIDISPGVYRAIFLLEGLQRDVELKELEIRRGFYYGELPVVVPSTMTIKK